MAEKKGLRWSVSKTQQNSGRDGEGKQLRRMRTTPSHIRPTSTIYATTHLEPKSSDRSAPTPKVALDSKSNCQQLNLQITTMRRHAYMRSQSACQAPPSSSSSEFTWPIPIAQRSLPGLTTSLAAMEATSAGRNTLRSLSLATAAPQAMRQRIQEWRLAVALAMNE